MASRHATAAPSAQQEAARAQAPPSRPRAPRRAGGRERYVPYLLIALLLAIFVGFYLWPTLVTMLSSFFR